MSWWLPPAASSFAGEIDSMFVWILVVTGLAFVIVEAALVWFSVRYRGRPDRRAFYTHGSTRAEIIWSSVPAVVVVFLALKSNALWTRIKGRDSVPANAYPMALTAKQFEWNVTYPGPDGQLETGDDFQVRGQLHLALGRPVVLHLTSEDVIHSFYVPQFRMKQDAVPGMKINVWFEPTVAGEYEIGCAELCGMGHYRMRGRVWVWPAAQFDACAQKTDQDFVDCLRPPPPDSAAAGVGRTTE